MASTCSLWTRGCFVVIKTVLLWLCVSSGGGGVPLPGCVSGSPTFGPSAFQHGAQCHVSALGHQRLRPGVTVVRWDHGVVADAHRAVAGASKDFEFAPLAEYKTQVLLMFHQGWSAENQWSRFTNCISWVKRKKNNKKQLLVCILEWKVGLGGNAQVFMQL